MPPAMPVEQRFWRHVDRSGGPEACWPWTAFVHPETGYGKVMMLVAGRWVPRQAHRVAFELTRGPIPGGHHLDHLCRTRICVNPAHLDPVLQAENNRRAESGHAKKTHCPAGHPYDASNTYLTPRGSRDCRTCISARSARRRERVRAARALVAATFVAAAMALPVRAGEPSPTVGIASHYGPGSGVATQWCTWTLRHSRGCGWLQIQSHDTGIVVVAPVVDWCQCYRGTADERIVDLQWGVVDALGLDRAQGLYPVSTWPIDPAETPGLPPSPVVSDEARASGASVPALPDTAVEPAEERDDTR